MAKKSTSERMNEEIRDRFNDQTRATVGGEVDESRSSMKVTRWMQRALASTYREPPARGENEE